MSNVRIKIKTEFDDSKLYSDYKNKAKQTEIALAGQMKKNYAKYVPLRTSVLSLSAKVENKNDKTKIVYKSKYAHYMWKGKVYRLKNGSTWAKRGQKKFESTGNIKYGNGRSKKWTEKAKTLHLKQWTTFANKYFRSI